MKKLIAAIALGAGLTCLSLAQTTTTTSTTTTTTAAGTVTTFTPGQSLIVRPETGEPITYSFAEKVEYVTAAGQPVEVTQIKAGTPVTVHYVKEADGMVVSRVVVREKDDDDDDDDN